MSCIGDCRRLLEKFLNSESGHGPEELSVIQRGPALRSRFRRRFRRFVYSFFTVARVQFPNAQEQVERMHIDLHV